MLNWTGDTVQSAAIRLPSIENVEFCSLGDPGMDGNGFGGGMKMFDGVIPPTMRVIFTSN